MRRVNVNKYLKDFKYFLPRKGHCRLQIISILGRVLKRMALDCIGHWSDKHVKHVELLAFRRRPAISRSPHQHPLRHFLLSPKISRDKKARKVYSARQAETRKLLPFRSSSERSTLTCLPNIYRTNAGKIRCPEWDSNPRHPDLMKCALTTELPRKPKWSESNISSDWESLLIFNN